MIHGMRVIKDPHLPRFKMVQFRFPRSKRKRIRNKFAKCDDNFKQVPITPVVIVGENTMGIHPDDLDRMMKTFTLRPKVYNENIHGLNR